MVFCGAESGGGKKIMTGERSQLSQWEPGSHLCWPCVAGLPYQCQSHYAVRQGGECEWWRMAVENSTWLYLETKSDPTLLSQNNRPVFGGLISEKWHEFMEMIPLWVWCSLCFPNCHFDKMFSAYCLTVNSHINQVFKSWKNKPARVAVQRNQSFKQHANALKTLCSLLHVFMQSVQESATLVSAQTF